MGISIRRQTPRETDALIRFCNENTGWGFTRETWEHVYGDPPLGRSFFVLAVDDASGEIVGQFGFIPSLVAANGKMIRAARPVAAVVKKDLGDEQQLHPLHDVIFPMYAFAAEALKAEGVGLIHIMPDSRWMRLFRMKSFFLTATFPMYLQRMPMSRKFELPAGYAVEALDPTDARIDLLWREACRLYPCIVLRDSRILAWKMTLALTMLTGVTHESRLVGLFASTLNEGGRQWLLNDLMTIDARTSLRVTLMAACNVAHDYVMSWPESHRMLNRVSLLTPPLVEPVAADLGFEQGNYRFGFVVHVLDPELPVEQVAPETWYISPND